MRSAKPTRKVSAPGSGGVLAPRPEDFWVDETLPYVPSGRGQHVFVRVVKARATTAQAVRTIASRLGVPAREVGVAGLKDQAAVTRQWLSLPWPLDRELPPLDETPAPVADGLGGGALPESTPSGIWVEAARRHDHKLRRGHVAKNRFRIRLREVPDGGLDRARAAVSELAQIGLPNAYGAQRFGRERDNAERALRILAGRERPPRDRSLRVLLYSALQAELFNRVLELRWARGFWSVALPGDVMLRHAPPALFDVLDPAIEQPRLERFEISPTGPLFGKKTRPAHDAAAELERGVLEESGVSADVIGRLGPGSRRPLRLPLPPDLEVEEPVEGLLELGFSLPAGAYATVLLEELCAPSSVRATPAQNDSGSGPT